MILQVVIEGGGVSFIFCDKYLPNIHGSCISGSIADNKETRGNAEATKKPLLLESKTIADEIMCNSLTVQRSG